MLELMKSVLSFCLIYLTTVKAEYLIRDDWIAAPTPSFKIGPSREGYAPEPSDDSSGATLAPESTSTRRIFDVMDYGAVTGGKTDNHLAFLAAWSDACENRGSSTFLVPKGTFFLHPVIFEGPCNNINHLNIHIAGTLKAPSELEDFPDHTWIMIRNLKRFTLTGAGTGLLDGQGQKSWTHGGCKSRNKCKEYPHSLRFRSVSNATICNVALLNSKNIHISFLDSSDIIVRGINITAPEDSPNTDGIHVSRSTNVNITSSKIGTGDDCVSIGPGNTNITILDITCGPGHGISVGSLGRSPNEKEVVGVTVRNCSFNGTDNGVRIKSWPGQEIGKAYNISFQDINMINVSNPIIIDQQYCPGDSCDSTVSSVNISNILFENIRGTSQTLSAVTLKCSPKVPCKNVVLKDIDLAYIYGDSPASSTCSNVKGVCYGKQQPIPCFDSN